MPLVFCGGHRAPVTWGFSDPVCTVLPFRSSSRRRPRGTVAAGQRLMRTWSPVITDFQGTWTKATWPSPAGRSSSWYVCVCSRWCVKQAVCLVAFSRGAWENRITCDGPQVGELQANASFAWFLPQFNCSLRPARHPSRAQDPPTRNVTFSMDLYTTDLFLAPAQGVFSVAENGHVYVEVRAPCPPRLSAHRGRVTAPGRERRPLFPPLPSALTCSG